MMRNFCALKVGMNGTVTDVEGNHMLASMTAEKVLDREFLEIRAKILELAASFDRFDRGDGSVRDDPRMRLIHRGVEMLQEDSENRAERIQRLFSREYDANWRNEFQM